MYSYYAFFDSHMRFACQIWGQIQSKIFDMIQHAQNKAFISFKQFYGTFWTFYLTNWNLIVYLKNSIILDNSLFVFDKPAKNLPDVFYQIFKFSEYFFCHHS